MPRTQRPGGPAILVGGNGKGRTLSLAARYASEWNAIFLKPEEYQALNSNLDQKILAARRELTAVKRSLMTGLLFGVDQASLERAIHSRGSTSAEELRQRGVIVGTPGEVIDQIGALTAAGVQGIMLQWLDLDDLAGLEALAKSVLPKV